MSTPVNPLNQFNTSSVKHMLVAFKYTDDAEKTKIDPTLGNPGDIIVGAASKGPGIIIANEFTMSDFTIYGLEWTYDFYGPISNTTSSVVGYIEITDRTGLHFVDFMKTKVIPTLGVSEGHIVYALKTFFVGTGPTGNDVLVGNPLIFNMATFINDLSQKSGRFYTMAFVGSSTTFGQLNQYSKIYQMTVTHSDGNLHKETPTPNVAQCALQSRKQEDSIQFGPRKTRIDKSKPMRTLKELFAAFETELNQQKFPNAAQLESWLQKVNVDYSVKIIPPIQKKVGGIPVDYFVHLDPVYNDYEVDNRNLPFEQPEQDQNKKGIRSVSIKTATDISVAIEKLMKLSQRVGQEAQLDLPFIFKTAISMIKAGTDRYQVHVVIKRVQIPENKADVNTGPGAGAINPLQFTYQDPGFADRDIIELHAKVTSDVGAKILEEQTQDTSALVVYGDREQITAERLPDVDYFNTQYSGMRPMVNPYENYGVESGVNASKIDNAINIDLRQQTSYSILINGNPFLMYDLCRLPSDVANGLIGNAQYYKLPEVEPMYAKLSIYLRTHAMMGVETNENVSNKFYFENYYHLHRVVNRFDSGLFTQKLYMLRTDESI
jgi:hypothetical protein